MVLILNDNTPDSRCFFKKEGRTLPRNVAATVLYRGWAMGGRIRPE